MFDGAPTRERHEFYDADGNRCPASEAWEVLVVRDSPWDETSRTEALELAAFEKAGSCPGCGAPVEEAEDPDAVWVVEKAVCYACRARKVAQRGYEKKHENSAEGHDDHITGWYPRPFDPERDKMPARSPTRPDRGPQQQNGRSKAMRR